MKFVCLANISLAIAEVQDEALSLLQISANSRHNAPASDPCGTRNSAGKCMRPPDINDKNLHPFGVPLCDAVYQLQKEHGTEGGTQGGWWYGPGRMCFEWATPGNGGTPPFTKEVPDSHYGNGAFCGGWSPCENGQIVSPALRELEDCALNCQPSYAHQHCQLQADYVTHNWMKDWKTQHLTTHDAEVGLVDVFRSDDGRVRMQQFRVPMGHEGFVLRNPHGKSGAFGNVKVGASAFALQIGKTRIIIYTETDPRRNNAGDKWTDAHVKEFKICINDEPCVWCDQYPNGVLKKTDIDVRVLYSAEAAMKFESDKFVSADVQPKDTLRNIVIRSEEYGFHYDMHMHGVAWNVANNCKHTLSQQTSLDGVRNACSHVFNTAFQARIWLTNPDTDFGTCSQDSGFKDEMNTWENSIFPPSFHETLCAAIPEDKECPLQEPTTTTTTAPVKPEGFECEAAKAEKEALKISLKADKTKVKALRKQLKDLRAQLRAERAKLKKDATRFKALKAQTKAFC